MSTGPDASSFCVPSTVLDVSHFRICPRDDNGDPLETRPVEFMIFPTMDYEGDVVQLIEINGGEVTDYDERNKTGNTIVLISALAILEDEKYLELNFPNDGFDIEFVQEYLNNQQIDMKEWQVTPTLYKSHDPKDVLIHRKTWNEIGKLSKEPDRFIVRYYINRANDSDELEDSDEYDEDEEIVLDEPESKEVAKAERKPMVRNCDDFFLRPGPNEMTVDEPVSKMAGTVSEANILLDDEPDDNEIMAGTASESSGTGFRPRKISSTLFSSDEEDSDSEKNSYENVTYVSDESEAKSGYSTISKTPTPIRPKKTDNPSFNYKEKRSRLNYKTEDGQTLLDLIVANKWGHYIGGSEMWQFIEHSKILEETIGIHSWQSLKNHFQKILKPRIFGKKKSKKTTYIISKEDAEELKRHMDRKFRLVFQWPALEYVKGIDVQKVKEFVKKLSEKAKKN